MLTVTPRTATLLNIVTAQLPLGHVREIDTTGGKFSSLFVVPVSERTFQVAQFTVHGDEMLGDPAIEFFKLSTGEWTPMCLTRVIRDMPVRHELNDQLSQSKIRRTLRFFIFFADKWLGETVVGQQGGLLAIRRAVDRNPSAYQH